MITEVIILAGGKGSRLRSVVSDIPKPMALVADKPFLEYLLQYLSSQGISKVVLSVGYKAYLISSYFGDNYKGMHIQYAEEEKPLGTGGAVAMAMKKTSGDSVFVLNGDTLSKISFNEMSVQHDNNIADATIAVKFMKDASRYGTVEVGKTGRINNFIEKRISKGFINTGVYIFSRKWFHSVIPNEISFSLEQDVLEKGLKNSALYAFQSEGYFIDIGIPKDYHRAQKEIIL